jgi:hypothetical protein
MVKKGKTYSACVFVFEIHILYDSYSVIISLVSEELPRIILGKMLLVEII